MHINSEQGKQSDDKFAAKDIDLFRLSSLVWMSRVELINSIVSYVCKFVVMSHL